MALPNQIDKSQREKLAKITKEKSRLDREIDARPLRFIAQIYRLRGALGPKPRDLNDLGPLKTNDEVDAYHEFRESHMRSILDRNNLSFDSLSVGSLGSKVSDNLQKQMRQIETEMRK
jgi:hypothetical protein